MECEPGEEAQVDFRKGAPGHQLRGEAIASASVSDRAELFAKAYSGVVPRQTTEQFIRCIENAFAHFGGLPKTLVIDSSLKCEVSAIRRPMGRFKVNLLNSRLAVFLQPLGPTLVQAFFVGTARIVSICRLKGIVFPATNGANLVFSQDRQCL